MDLTHKHLLVDSKEAASNLYDMHRFVKIDSSGKAALCGLNEEAAGTVIEPVNAGEQASICTTGIVIVETGGIIAAGDRLTSDAQGRAIKLPVMTIENGTVAGVFTLDTSLNATVPAGSFKVPAASCNGLAYQSASGVGELIQVLLT
jgi:hypothetical protein